MVISILGLGVFFIAGLSFLAGWRFARMVSSSQVWHDEIRVTLDIGDWPWTPATVGLAKISDVRIVTVPEK